MQQDDSGQVFTLGDCLLDLSRGLVLRDGQPVPLRPKAYALLAHLAANAGRVVGKSELIEAVWPGVFVTEDSLTQAVRELRKSLGDGGEGAIRTIARRGYLLSPAPAQPEQPGGQPALAVLRFRNDGSEADAVLVDGLAEDILDSLARFGRVSVLARNSGFAFASGGDVDWRSVGRRLGADFLVGGRMRLAGDRLEARISLIEAATGALAWSGSFEASGAGVFAMQEEIALKIVNRLVARLDDAGLTRSAAKPPASLAAYEMLLRGLARLRGYRAEDNVAAKALFEQAVARDPGYALAHGYVALAELAIAGYGEAPPAVLAAVADRADHAVTLAPEEPRCHRVLGLARLFAREYDAAEHHLRRSLELNPCDADTMAQMGFLLVMRGRPLEALASLDRAVRINPIHPDWYHYDRSIALYAAGDYRGAVASLSTLAVQTPWRLTRLAACHAQLGETAQARRLIEEIGRIAPDYSPLAFARSGMVFEYASDLEHLVEGVEKALAAAGLTRPSG